MFTTVNLEMSIKPFKKTDTEYIRKVCSKIFHQWYPLLKSRKVISVMLWVADGSEILDYNKKLTDEFEWCKYLGNANARLLGDDEKADISLHERKQYYMEDPPKMTYGILKTIVSTLKEEGKKRFPDSVIRVGETFDIGPEFSVSDFKYRRHREITSGKKLDGFGFVDATSLLFGDEHEYAAYPNGIPDKTPFAVFFGKQANIFLEDMGFDYIWLSNGLGFSANPWEKTGKIFDGENFYPEKLPNTAKQVFDFWKMFRAECPDFPIKTRGTNNSAGIDYATDGVPLYDIYHAGFNITPPPNSPWAALNDDFGLEIMGHMTRICDLPCDEFMFRYYIHDPWWANSPWYDRFNGSPHDIYLPMAITRIDSNGKVRSAETLNILSIDNSLGNMPDACCYEPLPHILKAEKDAPDQPAPLVWVYPVREYTTSKESELLSEMYYGDNFIRNAINDGFPLNCVVSTDNFLKTPLSLYRNSVLISPIPETKQVADKLEMLEKSGGNVIYYGSEIIAKKRGFCKEFIPLSASSALMRKKLSDMGYLIEFNYKSRDHQKTVITISRYDNALSFSVYNPDTTTETLLHCPLGAPVFTGISAEIRNNNAVYHFQNWDHRECRVFVEQKSGVVSLKEKAPVSGMYHRKIHLSGLEDATVSIFPEDTKDKKLAIATYPQYSDGTPEYVDSFIRVEDEKYGIYYRGEHISGDCYILLPYKNIK